MTPVAKKLREKRKERSYTQTDVANLLHITLRQYMNYEKDHLPPHEQLLKLNLLFDFDFSRLIYDRKTTERKYTHHK